jgi:hypothetical protein
MANKITEATIIIDEHPQLFVNIAPIFRCLPLFVKGIPVFRAIFCFTRVIPMNRFHEKPPLFGIISSLIKR